ncbi:MAG: hypothetical protein JXA96_04055 [Sedimentisphaerales bacterium]|nr:hypothetical protein [Sedimentisphaerales bacterium]
MKTAEYIKRIVENAKIKINPEVKKSALNELINKLEKAKNIDSVKLKPDIGRIIMNSKITKLAAAAIIIFVVIIGINQFGNGNTAFAEVIGYFQKHTYTFDLEGLTTKPIHAKVWELGRIRLDFPATVDAGEISSITDLNTGHTLLLFHQDKTAAVKKELFFKNITEEPISLCTKPIAELWNVLDGAEEYLGENEIDGKRVSGFRITKEDQNYKYDITLWADYKKGFPYMVETTAKSLDQPSLKITMTMKNFNLDTELDEKLFSLELPSGYIIAYQENLEDIKVESKLTPEAEKIVQILNLASEDKKDEALDILMTIDWSKPIEFGKEPYIFSISEKAYKALKADDQKLVLEQNSTNMTSIRDISFNIIDRGKIEISLNRYEEAEKYLVAALQLGKLLERNPDSMLIVQLVGISIEKKALNEMIPFYTSINDNAKLQDAKEQLSAAETVAENIKKQSKELSK